MSKDSRLPDLLMAWEQAQARGKPVSPEELCRDCPDLLEPLRRQVGALGAMRPVLDVASFAEGEKPTRDTAPSEADSFWDSLQRKAASRPLLPAPPGYEVLEVVDRGGMGIIFKARQVALDRLVALKMIESGPRARPKDLERFHIEARAVARLQHPNIVQIHDQGTVEGYPYLVLEFLEGGDLENAMRGQPLPPKQAAEVAEVLARAINHAHKNNIIHRDLKPSNVLLTSCRKLPDGRLELGTPKIADFGLARQLGEAVRLTGTGVVIGTPAYMAPEQAAGQRLIGPATDVHGLGALLYQLLTGAPPFESFNDIETTEKVVKVMPDPPSKKRPEVPPALDAICYRCLRKAPADRYPSAEALADDLKRFLAGEPITTPPPPAAPPPAPTPVAPPAPPAAQPPWLLIAAVVVLAVGACFMTWRLLSH